LAKKKIGERGRKVLSKAQVIDAEEVLKEKKKDLKKRAKEAERVRKREEKKNVKQAKEAKKKG
jgi:hypothetical protein